MEALCLTLYPSWSLNELICFANSPRSVISVAAP
jgi:hypothetical protein